MIALLIVLLVTALIIGFGVWKKQLSSYSWRRSLMYAAIPFIGISLSFLPVGTSSQEDVANSTDVLFIVDITYSMNARDGSNLGRQLSRLEHVQAHLKEISSALEGSRVAILAYDNATSLYLPLTTSSRDVTIAAETLFTKSEFQSVLPPSTGNGLEEARSYLARQREVDDTRRQVVVFMTDGELNSELDNPDELRAQFNTLLSEVQGGLIIGYGSETGTTIPSLRYDSLELEVVDSGFNIYDFDGRQDAVTSRGEEFLSSLASNHAPYTIANDTSDIAAQAEELRQNAGTKSLNNGTTRALSQNTLHVPFAALVAIWVVAFEIWQVPKIRSLLVSKEHDS